MAIRSYYTKIIDFCSSLPLISDFNLDFEEIDEQTGYISGILNFIDASNLYISEYFEIRNNKPERIKYRYHWQKADLTLIKRWDNVPHHQNVSTYPFHLHEKDKIFSSQNMDIFKVIKEVEKAIA